MHVCLEWLLSMGFPEQDNWPPASALLLQILRRQLYMPDKIIRFGHIPTPAFQYCALCDRALEMPDEIPPCPQHASCRRAWSSQTIFRYIGCSHTQDIGQVIPADTQLIDRRRDCGFWRDFGGRAARRTSALLIKQQLRATSGSCPSIRSRVRLPWLQWGVMGCTASALQGPLL